jgi:hypothetical protein
MSSLTRTFLTVMAAACSCGEPKLPLRKAEMAAGASFRRRTVDERVSLARDRGQRDGCSQRFGPAGCGGDDMLVVVGGVEVVREAMAVVSTAGRPAWVPGGAGVWLA